MRSSPGQKAGGIAQIAVGQTALSPIFGQGELNIAAIAFFADGGMPA